MNFFFCFLHPPSFYDSQHWRIENEREAGDRREAINASLTSSVLVPQRLFSIEAIISFRFLFLRNVGTFSLALWQARGLEILWICWGRIHYVAQRSNCEVKSRKFSFQIKLIQRLIRFHEANSKADTSDNFSMEHCITESGSKITQNLAQHNFMFSAGSFSSDFKRAVHDSIINLNHKAWSDHMLLHIHQHARHENK